MKIQLKNANIDSINGHEFVVNKSKIFNFTRQKPVENFIVDFYAPAIKDVIEVDGSQHFEEIHLARDGQRDDVLQKLHLKILRFDNSQVLQSIDDVLDVIFNETPDI